MMMMIYIQIHTHTHTHIYIYIYIYIYKDTLLNNKDTVCLHISISILITSHIDEF